jgi:trimeric autotransporter adhesin
VRARTDEAGVQVFSTGAGSCRSRKKERHLFQVSCCFHLPSGFAAGQAERRYLRGAGAANPGVAMSYTRLTNNSHRIALLASCVFAAGALAFSTGTAVAGCNSGNALKTALLSSIDCQADASGNNATAVGSLATALGINATAVGVQSYAKGLAATAIGAGSGNQTTVVEGATSLGVNSGLGAGASSTSLGTFSNAKGDFSIAIGGGPSGTESALAQGFRSVAVGQKSVSADFGTSVGFNTNTAFASTAVGTDARAPGDSSSAFGRFAKASGINAVALGVGAVASKPRSVAIGSGSIANVADTVSVGASTARRRIVNVAPAVANSDAVTFAQAKSLAAAAAQMANADLQREVAELRVVVQQQQQELVAMKSRQATTALQE